MENKLTISEIECIYNLAGHKTDEELSAIIKKPVAIIQMQFALIDGLPNRPWEKGPELKPASLPKTPKKNKIRSNGKERISHAERKVIREQKQVQKKNEKTGKKPLSAHAQALDRLKMRKDRCGKSIYATRKLDLTGTIPVKLNNRTTVWVKPGADIEELKKKYKIA
jgi:hypothetical protein